MKENSTNQKNMLLVSVIIPFYNVGNDARYTLESLLLQDYENCEFICVDDGSTDNSLDILKEYDGDQRVKIIHKENGGLSDARNCGLDHAVGDYVSFIDGGDYVHPQYIMHLVNAVNGKKSQVVIGRLRIVKYQNQLDIKAGWAGNVSHYELNKRDVFEKILYNELSVSACAKLVPRDAYDDVRFPLGKVSEEVAIIGKLLRKFDTFSVIEQPLYGYVMSPGSIGRKKIKPFKEIQDRFDSLEEFESVIRQEFNLKKDKSLERALIYRWGLRYVDMAAMYESVEDNKKAAMKVKKKAHTWLKNNIKTIASNQRAPKKQRIGIWLYTYFPKLYILLFALHQKIKYNI